MDMEDSLYCRLSTSMPRLQPPGWNAPERVRQFHHSRPFRSGGLEPVCPADFLYSVIVNPLRPKAPQSTSKAFFNTIGREKSCPLPSATPASRQTR